MWASSWIIAACFLFIFANRACAFQSFHTCLTRRPVSVLKAVLSAFEYEKWAGQQSIVLPAGLAHATYPGEIRGLTWNPNNEDEKKQTSILRIPEHLVLSSDFNRATWDADLAVKLWKEVEKGSNSDISGYCQWLERPSAAPNTLRRWTDEEREYLSKEDHGMRMLDLLQQQEASWREKYKSVAATSNEMSWDDFVWCMEVVHSRAFRGIGSMGDDSNAQLLASLGAPVLAGIAGLVYFQTNSMAFTGSDSTPILAAGLVVATLPLVLQQFQKQKASAVLLPLIDSANHKPQADSLIQYDPLQKSFELTAEMSCIDTSFSPPQLFINYGDKSDEEFLLNFGFLPGVNLGDLSSRSSQRKLLAEAYLDRKLPKR